MENQPFQAVTDVDVFMPCAKYKGLGEPYGYCTFINILVVSEVSKK